MASQKPSIPKGTRDFGPAEMVRRNYIFSLVREVFKKYGYLPLETPAMENLSTLLGKYGEEGDKLLFRILNSGDFLSKVAGEDLLEKKSSKLSGKISEKGLKYDLTVPFARFVVQHQNEIGFPFKRFQIQPVWRADRPQKGRYREFYQCDVDVIGSKSLLSELELIQIIDEIFAKLGMKILVKINNRKVLAGLSEVLGHGDKMIAITMAMDKIDKIGLEGVCKELREKEISEGAIEKLKPVLSFQGNSSEKLNMLTDLLSESAMGQEGIRELRLLLEYSDEVELGCEIELDLSLARGLNYYTGAIIEVVSTEYNIGSVCGGGRYDDLTGIFGLKDISGVGVSFGADRIYDTMDHLGLFPDKLLKSTQVMFANFGIEEAKYCLSLLNKVRKAGIHAEIYPDPAKMKKQMSYANNKNVQYVALVGEEEMKNQVISLKNMDTGTQESLTVQELIAKLKTR